MGRTNSGMGGAVLRGAIPIILLFVLHIALGEMRRDFEVTADGREYLQMAHHLLDDGTFTYDGVNPVVGKPPGLPILAAGYLQIFGGLGGFQFLQLIMLFGAYLFMMAVAGRMLDPPWPTFLLFLLVLADPLRALAYNLLSEPAFLLTTTAGLYCVIRTWESRQSRWAVFAGLMIAVSTYLRPINLFWPVLLVLSALLFDKSQARRAIVILVVHVAVLAPWMVRNASHFDKLVPMVSNWGPLYYMTDEALWQTYFFDGSGHIRASASYQEITEGEFQFNWRPSQRFLSGALTNISDDPAAYLGRCLRQAAFAWSYLPGTKASYTTNIFWFSIGRGLMLLFYCAIGWGAYCLGRRNRRMLILIGGYAVYTAGMLFPVTTESRYLIPVYLALLPVTLVGITGLWYDYLAPRWRRKQKLATTP